MDRTLRVDYHIPSKFKASQLVVDLIGKMLRKEPGDRITITEIYDDPWFKQNFPDSVCPQTNHWQMIQIPCHGQDTTKQDLAVETLQFSGM